MQAIRSTCPRGVRTAALRLAFSLLLLLALGYGRAVAQPMAIVVNPQHTDWLSNGFSTSGIGASYVINGMLHNADHVDIKITHVPTSTVVVDTGNPAFSNPVGADNHQATINGLTWEYRWDMAGVGNVLPQGQYLIKVTPKLGTQVGKHVNGDYQPVVSFWVYVVNSDPGAYQTLAPAGSLEFTGLTTTSGLFVGNDQIQSGSYARLPIRVRSEATPGRILKTTSLTETTSFPQVLAANLANVNNVASTGVPGVFQLGGATPIQNGISTVALFLTDNTGDFMSIGYDRSIIVDKVAPTVSPTSILYPTKSVAYFYGTATDPKPGAGAPSSGIARVDLTIQPPSGGMNTVSRPAALAYGGDPSQPVNWSVAYPFVEVGNYVITAVASDSAGNKTTSITTIDVEVPTVTVGPITATPNFPVDYVGGGGANSAPTNVALAADITGGTNPVTWTIYDNDVPIPGATGTGTHVAFNWPTAVADESDHTIRVEAVDSLGRMGANFHLFHVDNKNPGVIINAPLDNQAVGKSIHVTGTVSDKYLDHWTLFDKDGVTPLASGNTGTVDYTFTPASNTEAVWSVTLQAWDKAQNTAGVTRNFRVDTVKPTVNITDPANDQFVPGTSRAISISVADGSGINWTVNSNGNQIGSGTFPAPAGETRTTNTATITWNIPAGTEKDVTLFLHAEDEAGNENETHIVVHADNVLPVPSLTSPSNGSFVSAVTAIGGTIKDKYPDTWQLMANGGPLPGASSGTGATVSYSLDPTFFGAQVEQDVTLSLHAVDKAGNASSPDATLLVHVDTMAPRVNFTTPVNGSYVTHTVPITFTVADNYLASWTVSADGKTGSVNGLPNSTGTVPGTYTIQWDTTTNYNAGAGTAFADVALTIHAVDMAGHVTDVTWTVHVANLPPNPVISSPKDQQVVGGTVNITGTVSDQYLAEWNLYAKPSGGAEVLLKGDATGNPLVTATWDTNDITQGGVHFNEGDVTLRLSAKDKAGTINETSITVHVDNLAPRLSLTPPNPAIPLHGNGVNVSGSAVDANLQEWTLFAGGKQLGKSAAFPPAPPAAVSVNWDTLTTHPGFEGKVTLSLQGKDQAGNATSAAGTPPSQPNASIDVDVDNKAPVLSNVGPTGPFVLNTLVVTGVATDAYLDTVTVNVKLGAATVFTQSFTAAQLAPTNGLFATTALNNLISNATYTIEVIAKDKAAQDPAAASAHTTTYTGQITIVRIPTAKLTLLTPSVDQNGKSYAGGTFSSDQGARQAVSPLYVGSSFTGNLLRGDFTNQTAWTLTDLNPINGFGGTLDQQTNANAGFIWPPFNGGGNATADAFSEGLRRFSLVAVNAASTPSLPAAEIDVVVDTTKPVATILSPITGTVVPLGSTLVLQFTLDNTTGASVRSPMQLSSTDQNDIPQPDITGNGIAPLVQVTINNKSHNNYSLIKALLGTDPNVSGTARISGTSLTTYTVTWSIPISTTQFTAGSQYTVTVMGATDVAGNGAIQKTATFRVGLN